ncbi:MAG: 2-oxoacid:acceptor oxidoreductase family protein [Candidatus Omnitrophica bacterium]|nr:2-oxoacid:acceptor oxidoreductase family protein [Candidatus Omnitrophota bacterium]
MKEVIFYGRGGQGAVIASRILAVAAFKEGRHVQAFPFFGVERRGAPVTAYTRIDDFKIRKRGPVTKGDYIVILDPTLLDMSEIVKHAKRDASVIINTNKEIKGSVSSGDVKVIAFDASMIAVNNSLGSQNAPIVNTTMLGVFSKITGEVAIDSVIDAISENISVKKDSNINAAREAYEKAKK